MMMKQMLVATKYVRPCAKYLCNDGDDDGDKYENAEFHTLPCARQCSK